jgi:cell division protein FtsN
LAQDDYYYEIQLTNKQLVFYFMAGAAGLILSFLAGVMVGRGIDAGAAAAGGAETRQIAEEKVVTEQTPAPAATEYTYPQRLESERATEGLEKPVSGSPAPSEASARPATAQPRAARSTPVPPTRSTPVPAARPAATPVPATPNATPNATPRPPVLAPSLPRAIGSNANVKGFAVQVGAFKDRASADTVVKSLKGRGLPAFAVAPAGGGLYTVRVGVYRDRADAESVQGRLRDDKFKPYIIKQ